MAFFYERPAQTLLRLVMVALVVLFNAFWYRAEAPSYKFIYLAIVICVALLGLFSSSF